jgi:ABC-type amino acid transport substrate-binding protein
MKKIVSLIIALALCLGLCACGAAGTTAATGTDSASASSKPSNRLEEIKSRGYIEVATEPYFVPFEFIDSAKTGDEQYVGVDIEIAKYIASKLGVELRIVPLEFSAVLAGITTGKYDLAISALAYSPAREENMNMSEGYYFEEDSGGYGFLVRSEDKDKYTSLDSLKDAVVVTQSGSVQESLVNDQVKAYKEFKRVSSMTDGFLMIGEKKADVCVCDVQNGQLYADANPVTACASRISASPSTNPWRAPASAFPRASRSSQISSISAWRSSSRRRRSPAGTASIPITPSLWASNKAKD